MYEVCGAWVRPEGTHQRMLWLLREGLAISRPVVAFTPGLSGAGQIRGGEERCDTGDRDGDFWKASGWRLQCCRSFISPCFWPPCMGPEEVTKVSPWDGGGQWITVHTGVTLRGWFNGGRTGAGGAHV